MESNESSCLEDDLAGELQQVQNELQSIGNIEFDENNLLENLSTKQVAQYAEGIEQRDEVIRTLQNKLEDTQEKFAEEKTQFLKEIEYLHQQLKKVSPQIALQDALWQDGTSRQHRELQEKLLRIQEERAHDKEQQLMELEELEKSFEEQLILHESKIRNELQLEFDQRNRILSDENETLLQKLSAAEANYKNSLDSKTAQLCTATNEIELMKQTLSGLESKHKEQTKELEKNLETIQNDHQLAMKNLRTEHEENAILIGKEMESLEELHKAKMDLISKQLEESNMKYYEVKEKLIATDNNLKQIQIKNMEQTIQMEELHKANEISKKQIQEMEDQNISWNLEKTSLKNLIVKCQNSLEEKKDPTVDKTIDCRKVSTVEEFKSLLRNLSSILDNIDRPQRTLLEDLEISNKKLAESMLLLCEVLKLNSLNIRDETPLGCHSSQADSAMSEESFYTSTNLTSPPSSLPLSDETAPPVTPTLPPSAQIQKFNEYLKKASDGVETLLTQFLPDSAYPRIAPLTYFVDQQCHAVLSSEDLIYGFIKHQQDLMEACQHLLQVTDSNEKKVPIDNVPRWGSVCKNVCNALRHPDTNVDQNNKAEKEYQQMVFKLMCQVTIQLLHYYSVSQSNVDKDTDLQLLETDEETSRPDKRDVRKYETLSLSFDSSMDIAADPLDEAGLNNTAASEDILEDLDKDRQVKNTLKSSLCPNLMSVLKGRSAALDDLESEIQEFIISLQARIGMLKIYMHSNDSHSHEESTLHQLSPKMNLSSFSEISPRLDQSTLGTTLKESVVPDQAQIECLLAELHAERKNVDELKRKLHESQGLLSGAQEESANLKKDKEDLEERTIKMVEEMQGGKIKIKEPETIKPFEVKQTIYEAKQEARSKARAYLASRSLERLSKEQLEERVGQLEILLEELSVESGKIIEQLSFNEQDLLQQLQAADKKVRSSRQFIDEQAAERDRELELLVKENEQLQVLLKEKEFQFGTLTNLQEEVECLQKELQDKGIQLDDQIKIKQNLLEAQSATSNKVKDLRDIIQTLETQLANKSKTADDLATQLEILQSEAIEKTATRDDTLSPSMSCSSKSPELRRDSCEHHTNFHLGLSLSIAEEIQNEDSSYRHAWNNSNQRIEEFMKKIDKMASALESTGFGSEEALSDRSEVPDTPMESELRRSLSPSSWEHILEEKFHSVECGMETVLKNNRDLKMNLKSAQNEVKEISSEYETLLKQMEEKCNETSVLTAQIQSQADQIKTFEEQAKLCNELKANISKCETKFNQAKKQLNEITSERDCLRKTNASNLMIISGLQARIDDLRRSDSSVESVLKSTINSLREENMKNENTISANFKQINAQRNAMNELHEKLISREEEIEKLKVKLSDQECVKIKEHEKLFVEPNSSQIEVQRLDHSNMSTPMMKSALLSQEGSSSNALSRTLEAPTKSLLGINSEILEEIKEVSTEDAHVLEATQENSVASHYSTLLHKSSETAESLRKQVSCLESEKHELTQAYELKQASLEKIAAELRKAQEATKERENAMEELRSSIKSQQEKIHNMEHEFAKIVQLNQKLQQEVLLLQKQAVVQKHQEENIRKLEETVVNLEMQLKTQKNEADSTRQQEIEKYNQEFKSLTSRNSDLSRQVEKLREQNSEQAEDLSRLTKKHAEIKADLENQISSMSSSLADSEERIRKLDEQLVKATQPTTITDFENSRGEMTTLNSTNLNQSKKMEEILDKLRRRGLEILSQAELAYLERCKSSLPPEMSLSNSLDSTGPPFIACSFDEGRLFAKSEDETQVAISKSEALDTLKASLNDEKARVSKLKMTLEAVRREGVEMTEKLHTERMKNWDILAEKNALEEKVIILKKTVDIATQGLKVTKKDHESLEQELEAVRAHLQEERDQFNLVSQTLNYQRKISADNDNHQRNIIEDLKKSLERERKRVQELISRRSLTSSVASLDTEEREKSLDLESVLGSRRRARSSQPQLFESENKVQQLEENINIIARQNKLLNAQLEAKMLEIREMRGQIVTLLDQKETADQLAAQRHNSGSLELKESQIILRKLRQKEHETEELREQISNIEHQLELVLLQGNSTENQYIEGLTLKSIQKINDLVNFHRKQNIDLFRKLFDLTSKQTGSLETDKFKDRISELEQLLKLHESRPVPHFAPRENDSAAIEKLMEEKNSMQTEIQAAKQLNLQLTRQVDILKSLNNDCQTSGDVKYGRLLMKKRRAESYRRSLVWQKKYLLHVLAILHRDHQKAMEHVATITQRISKSIPLNVSLPPDLPQVTGLGRFRAAVNTIIFIKRVRTVRESGYRKRLNAGALSCDEYSNLNSPTSAVTHGIESFHSAVASQSSVVGFTPPTKDSDNCVNIHHDIADARRKLFEPQGLEEYVERVESINTIMGISSPKRSCTNVRR